jgi:hypothetical protein
MIITNSKRIWRLFAIVALFLTGCDVTEMTDTPMQPTSTMPVPTLTTGERENLTKQLMTKDYNCNLPCWGGIEPGVTTWSDAKVQLEIFAQIYSSHLGIYTAEFQYKRENRVLAFYTRNNIIEFMGVPRFEYPLYRLLQDYGKPDEIYFYILDVLPIETNNPYKVFLFYKENGIIAIYDGVSAKGSTISVCFMDSQGQKSRTAFLYLWSKGSDMNFYDVVAGYMQQFSDYLALKYYRLEELSTSSVTDVYDTYLLEVNENQCLQLNNPNSQP